MKITNDIIEKTLDDISRRCGVNIDLDSAELGDKETKSILAGGLFFCATDFDISYLPSQILTDKELYGKYLSTLTYKCAYLKAHYTADFMANAISNSEIFEDTLGYFFDECSQLGIKILKPSILRSKMNFECMDKNTILYGFIGLQIPHYKLEEMLFERDSVGFETFESFVKSVEDMSFSKEEIEILIKSGSLDDFGHSRRAMLRYLLNQNPENSSFSEYDTLPEYAADSLSQMEMDTAKVSFSSAKDGDEKMVQKMALENGIELSKNALSAFKKYGPKNQYELERDMLRLDSFATLKNSKINSVIIAAYYAKDKDENCRS